VGRAQHRCVDGRQGSLGTNATKLCIWYLKRQNEPNCSRWASMTSLRQIQANRRNALKSTGPTTPEGKQRSRCNAMRHGLTAETVVAILENSEDYEAFEAAVISDYDAETAVERELVLRLASVLWRLRRATGIETAIFDSITEDARSLFSKPDQPLTFDTKNAIADRFLRLAALPTFALDRLSRYEYLLWRQARQIVFTLESLRRRKRAPGRISFPFAFRRRVPASSEEIM
jgi:hypothetical protein